MAASRPVLHLPGLTAAATALYAASLAFVTGQQAATDAQRVAAGEPMRQAAAQAARQREVATGTLQRAADALHAAADGYARAAAESAALDDGLAQLAELVGKASGAAASLPDRVVLAAPRTSVVTVVTQPPVQATTGASGR
jgi:hypothetical protein